MSRLGRLGLALFTSVLLIVTLSSTALASGGSGSGSGGSSGGGVDPGSSGGAAPPCGVVTLNAPTFTTYYQYFSGTATNCTQTTMDYVVSLNDMSTHTNPACQAPATLTSNRKAPLAPGTISYTYFKPLPCYDDYTIQAQLMLNRQVAATATINFSYTPTGIIMH